MRVIQAFSCAAVASSFPICTLLSQVSPWNVAASSDHTRSICRGHDHAQYSRVSSIVQRRRTRSTTATFWNLASSSTTSLAGRRDSYDLEAHADNSAIYYRGGGIEGKVVGAPKAREIYSQIVSFCNKRFFLVGAAVVIYAAKLAPGLGATGGIIRPEITVNKAALPLVFFLVGLAIRLGELVGAAANLRLNLLTQAFSLGVLPALGWVLARCLEAGGMHAALCDGVMILMTLPTTVNMCVILTQSAEGNVAAAAFNAVLGNLLGVIVTPALLLLLVGRNLEVAPSLVDTFKKLAMKVVLPLAVGQLARFTPLRKIQEQRSKTISRLSECVLLTVLYTTFCDTFQNAARIVAAGGEAGGGGGGVLTLVAVLPVVHLLSIACLDILSRMPFLELSERDRIAVMFCGSHKTLAFGIPLIKTMFEGHASVGMLSTPLLLYHPGELLLGSAIAPFLKSRAIARESAAAAAKLDASSDVSSSE